MDAVKMEGMYAYARARNLYESSRFRKFDGLETNFNTPVPGYADARYGILRSGRKYPEIQLPVGSLYVDLQAATLNSRYG